MGYLNLLKSIKLAHDAIELLSTKTKRVQMPHVSISQTRKTVFQVPVLLPPWSEVNRHREQYTLSWYPAHAVSCQKSKGRFIVSVFICFIKHGLTGLSSQNVETKQQQQNKKPNTLNQAPPNKSPPSLPNNKKPSHQAKQNEQNP